CSGKDRLCFSYRIALLPQEAVDYIVVHELAHIRRKDHSPRFYAEVAAILPDYKRRVALLRQTERELGL
ncbi:MAG: M48 family metallopeptidase, partial [Oscillospiraceae bacterium]|nr:M48 family metallopeptidase [Oscillospiraceae bacterium]